MSVNKELLKSGLEAEQVVLDYFNQFNLNAQQNIVTSEDKNSILHNMKFGDIYFEHDRHRLSFDVKRGHFISDKSLKNYRGVFYIFVPGGDLSDPYNFKVVKRTTIQHYISQVPEEKMHTGPSGSKGYRFTKLKNFVLLGDLVNEFIKRIIILGNQPDEVEGFGVMTPWTLYMIKDFTKVLPKHVKSEESMIQDLSQGGAF